MAKRNKIIGFFDSVGAPDVRASNLAKDSAVIFVGMGRPVNFAINDRIRRISGMERRTPLIVVRRLPKCSIRDMIA